MYIDETSQAMLARCASNGYSVVEVENRHIQEALRAELRRLARMAPADSHRRKADRVLVVRIDEQP